MKIALTIFYEEGKDEYSKLVSAINQLENIINKTVIKKAETENFKVSIERGQHFKTG